MENKKYKLTDETIEVEGKTLYRIEALKEFRDVLPGVKGGFVESEKNLSHEGKCWIANNACVYDNAVVRHDAIVYEQAIVKGNACISDSAKILQNALITDNATIYDSATVAGNACVCDEASVYGDARAVMDAKVCDFAEVYGRATVSENACVTDYAEVYGDAYVHGSALICNRAQVYGFANITDMACVSEKSKVYGLAMVMNCSNITDNAQVFDAFVAGNAVIGGDAVVNLNPDYIVFYCWFKTPSFYITWTRSNDKWNSGFFIKTSEELLNESDNNEEYNEYKWMVDYVEHVKENLKDNGGQ